MPRKITSVKSAAQIIRVSGIAALVLGFFCLNYWFASLVLPVLYPRIVFLIAMVMTAWGLLNFFAKCNEGGE